MNYCKGLRLALVIAAVAMFLGGAARPLSAQAMGSIRGTVTDSKTGNPLPGVQVTVEGTVRRTVTNGLGQFDFTIEPGTFTLMAVVLGYNKNLKKVSVTADGTSRLDFVLSGVGSSTDGPAPTGDQLASLMNEIKQQRRLIEAQQRSIDELLRRVALLEQKK